MVITIVVYVTQRSACVFTRTPQEPANPFRRIVFAHVDTLFVMFVILVFHISFFVTPSMAGAAKCVTFERAKSYRYLMHQCRPRDRLPMSSVPEIQLGQQLGWCIDEVLGPVVRCDLVCFYFWYHVPGITARNNREARRNRFGAWLAIASVSCRLRARIARH